MSMDKVNQTVKELLKHGEFVDRHIGMDENSIKKALKFLNLKDLQHLVDEAVPQAIINQDLEIPEGISETEALKEIYAIGQQNQCKRSLIGMGYYNTIMPSVIQRNVLENPGWYTAYTPYQAEISQGRLESLLNFQQMVMDLTGMDIANASLLDEATAVSEAMVLSYRQDRLKRKRFLIGSDIHPQTYSVLATKAEPLNIELVYSSDPLLALNKDQDYFGLLLQYPDTYGNIKALKTVIEKSHDNQILVTIATDLLALTLLQPPGELGADIVVGSSQRFGVPMGFGGPHAAFFATRNVLKRSIPGRIIGVSVDAKGNPCFRMAMQTREQHIRREKATSNICTAQALLANISAFYAVYHGAAGLKNIAKRVHQFTGMLYYSLCDLGFKPNELFFDTLTFCVGDQQDYFYDRALSLGYNLRKVDTEYLGFSLDETVTLKDLNVIYAVFSNKALDLVQQEVNWDQYFQRFNQNINQVGIPNHYQRVTGFLTHEIFNRYHSETELMRYIKKLENKDYSLVHGMIPLGSCTMKLNAASQLMPLSWPIFSDIHPFVPTDQAKGYQLLINQLSHWLANITGYDEFSLQPNSGSAGEYAGLLAIKGYHQSIGQGERNICLIPASAHGTNPASAVLAGLKVVVVQCDEEGNIDLEDLTNKVKQYADQLSTLMITYPSTHGIYEANIRQVCDCVHQAGGQVYMDGANMNAMVGIAKPGAMGSDVSHLNLHKTFAIPHGGGGPGVGPIGVKKHLAPFLPGNPIVGKNYDNKAVAAAFYGSASILTITWMYIRMLGCDGLRRSSQVAILSANYIAERLSDYYPILYRGLNGRIAHECLIDIRDIKARCGITEEDIAKRLMDYGFHAPTMSFPVPGTLMIEPTESESFYELERFIETMINIRAEIKKVENGQWDALNNPLKLAPHTQLDLVEDSWDRPYSRQEAVFPNQYTKKAKFWPSVNRVDNAYGDRNFQCSCPSIHEYS